MGFSAAQRHQAIGLYKELLRTTRKTFEGDAHAIAAAREETRRRFLAAAQEADAAKIDEGLKMGSEIVAVFRQNVVQGKWRAEREAYGTYDIVCKRSEWPLTPFACTELKMTKETELGTNESIKEARAKQIADLKAGKKPERKSCQEMAAQYQASTSPSTSAAGFMRSFSTSTRPFALKGIKAHAQQSSFSTSATARARDPSVPHWNRLPRTVPQFSSTTILADGSSIQRTTTSPRRIVRLTRDPTNHPLWNPRQERKVGGDGDDDSGRLGRFRRRFQEAEAAVIDVEAQTESAAQDAGSDVQFGQEDLDWMSGGQMARAGSSMAPTKKKGKK